MEVLWQRDAATVRHVLDVLNAGGSKIRAYTTVMTALHHLDQKRLVIRRRNGKADVYRPRLSRSVYRTARAEAQADALIARYGDAAYIAMARSMRQRGLTVATDAERRRERAALQGPAAARRRR